MEPNDPLNAGPPSQFRIDWLRLPNQLGGLQDAADGREASARFSEQKEVVVGPRPKPDPGCGQARLGLRRQRCPRPIAQATRLP